VHSESTEAPALSRPADLEHVGKSVERVEDGALLTGRGRFGDDLGVTAATLHAAVLRSPHAHAGCWASTPPRRS
jgi:2-furoyl-CoA dehydrogenase large subunit